MATYYTLHRTDCAHFWLTIRCFTTFTSIKCVSIGQHTSESFDQSFPAFALCYIFLICHIHVILVRWYGRLKKKLASYPCIQFPLASNAPIVIVENYSGRYCKKHAICGSTWITRCSGKYMAVCMLYRGDVVPNDVNSAIASGARQFKIDSARRFYAGFDNSHCEGLDEY